jgi:tripartite-type tricarboxylate transporter receptor subunit TctC
MNVKSFLAITALGLAAASSALAQTFPDKPVKVILPFPPGTGPDSVMRLVADQLAKSWRQQLIVENKPGGNGWIAMDAAKRAAPDGYTLVQVDASMMSLHPNLYKKLPFDPVKDFDPVATLYRTYFFVTVAADSKWSNVGDLIRAAKAKPGNLTYGSSGNGSYMHLGGAMLETQADVKMAHIPYKETSQVFLDINKGDIAWSFGTASTTAPLIKANKVKYLAVAAPKRQARFPDVPTVAEAGGPPNFELQTWIGLFAPHGVPRTVVSRINADIGRVLQDPEVRERLLSVGFEPLLQSPDDLRKAMAADTQTFKTLVGNLNISLD